MDNNALIIKHILALKEIMENTTDKRTKDRLDKQIIEMAKDFNINL